MNMDTSPRLIIVGFLRKACQLMRVYYCLSRKAGHIALVCYCRVVQEGQPAHLSLLLLRRACGGLARKLPAKWGDGKRATPGESQGCCVVIRNGKGWHPAPLLHPVRTGHKRSWAQMLAAPLGPMGQWGWQRWQEHGSGLGTGRAACRPLEKQNLGVTGGDPWGCCTQCVPKPGTQGIS